MAPRRRSRRRRRAVHPLDRAAKPEGRPLQREVLHGRQATAPDADVRTRRARIPVSDPDKKPALEALDGGKTEKPSPVRSEKELRDALQTLVQHYAVQKNYLQLQAIRLDLRETISASRDLLTIEAQIAALRFALKEAESIR